MSDNKEIKYEGWGAFDKTSIQGNFKWFEYEPKTFCDDDIEFKIQYCGVCASDLHTASSGWGDMSSMYPQVVGHEIVGEVLRVGDKVDKSIKVGDIVGVGAQCDSCQDCEYCDKGSEQYCNSGHCGTYAGKFFRDTPAKGEKSYGGYANYWRGPSRFVIPIPDNLDPAEAAPMLCGGATVYSPLVQYGAGKTAKDVGVVGLGGLGHFAVIFAKALGANVTVISHSDHKKDDAEKMGATTFISTGSKPSEAVKPHRRSLDLIISTSNQADMPLADYLSLLRPGGHFVTVGAPETDSIPKISPFVFIMGNVNYGGSAIGSPTTSIPEMLKFAGDHKVKAWTKRWAMNDVNKAIPDMHKGGARYRYVLVNEHNGGKMEA